jgi:hypothetical protein
MGSRGLGKFRLSGLLNRSRVKVMLKQVGNQHGPMNVNLKERVPRKVFVESLNNYNATFRQCCGSGMFIPDPGS